MDDKTPLFVDTNVLVYANVLETPLHERSLNAINTAISSGRAVWISRQIVREYLVTMTRPQTFETLPIDTVLEQVAQFLSRFNVADDTAETAKQLLKLMGAYDIGGKQVHDANIVATMLSYNIPSLLTHNARDFQRFSDVVKIESVDAN